MTHEQWTEVDEYIKELLLPADPILEEALRASVAAELPGNQRLTDSGETALPASRCPGSTVNP